MFCRAVARCVLPCLLPLPAREGATRCVPSTLALLIGVILLGAGPAAAQQQNPTPADCGLPAAGAIVADATWTLNDDCDQTGELVLANPTVGDPGLTITINGEGHTIRLGAGAWNFLTSTDNRNVVNLNKVTIDGQFNQRIHIVRLSGALNAREVTFTRGHAGVFVSGLTVTLNDVLFENNRSSGTGFGPNGLLNVFAGSSVTLNDAVFRHNRLNGVVVHQGGTLTTTGCLGFSGNYAWNVVHSDVWSGGGVWNDSSTGPCSGEEIGNRGQAQLPPPALMPCGMPGSGLIDSDATWTLGADCEDVGVIRLAQGVHVRIDGNGRRIAGPAGGNALISAGGGGSLTLDNLILERVQLLNYAGELTLTRSEYRGATRLGLIQYGRASFSNTLFENNSTPADFEFATLLYSRQLWNATASSFRDVIFRNNTGGGAAMLRVQFQDATLNLEGCILFENNQQPDFLAEAGATLNDNRGSCGDPPVVGPNPPEGGNPEADAAPLRGLPDDCFQRLGAIGLICRVPKEPGPTIEVWGVTPDSRGFFILEVRQPQVDAVQPEGLVACSADGRVAARVHADRNITISMGPGPEGKTHHVTLQNNLNDHVIGTVDTFTGRPCDPASLPTPGPTPATPAPARFVTRQAPRSDGSLVHVVQEGDTLWGIAAAYGIMVPHEIVERNDLADNGRWLTPGQELLIRDGN